MEREEREESDRLIRSWTSKSAEIWSTVLRSLVESAWKFVLNAAQDTPREMLTYTFNSRSSREGNLYAKMGPKPYPCFEFMQGSTGCKVVQ